LATLVFESPAPIHWKLPLPVALGAALVVHALLLLGLLYSSLFAPPKIQSQETIHVKLARLGTPRDAKLLPRKPAEPTAPPAPPVPVSAVPIQAQKPTPPRETAPKPEKNQDILKNALAKLGAQVDQTGQVDGFEHGTDDQTEGELYWARVKDRVLRFYIVPNTIPESQRHKLSASLEIHIAADGNISETRMQTSSGNPTFDRALLDAIKRVRAFPPPPAHLAKLAHDGVVLEFQP
jgi:colicin import membrane protein